MDDETTLRYDPARRTIIETIRALDVHGGLRVRLDPDGTADAYCEPGFDVERDVIRARDVLLSKAAFLDRWLIAWRQHKAGQDGG